MSEPTPEAVEAAAKAQAVADYERHFKRPVEFPEELWVGMVDEERDDYRQAVTAALSAAAPYLIREAQAKALEDAAEIFHHASSAALTLRARAAAVRDGAA